MSVLELGFVSFTAYIVYVDNKGDKTRLKKGVRLLKEIARKMNTKGNFTGDFRQKTKKKFQFLKNSCFWKRSIKRIQKTE